MERRLAYRAANLDGAHRATVNNKLREALGLVERPRSKREREDREDIGLDGHVDLGDGAYQRTRINGAE